MKEDKKVPVISLSWDGALKKSSSYRRTVAMPSDMTVATSRLSTADGSTIITNNLKKKLKESKNNTEVNSADTELSTSANNEVMYRKVPSPGDNNVGSTPVGGASEDIMGMFSCLVDPGTWVAPFEWIGSSFNEVSIPCDGGAEQQQPIDANSAAVAALMNYHEADSSTVVDNSSSNNIHNNSGIRSTAAPTEKYQKYRLVKKTGPLTASTWVEEDPAAIENKKHQRIHMARRTSGLVSPHERNKKDEHDDHGESDTETSNGNNTARSFASSIGSAATTMAKLFTRPPKPTATAVAQ